MSRWSSREQALADVARASGDGGRRLPDNVDDTCFVYGAARPPRRVINEDDDLHFDLVGGKRRARGTASAPPPPDLPGITRLLRMTDSYSGGGRESVGDSLGTILISKPSSDRAPRCQRPATDTSTNATLPGWSCVNDSSPDRDKFRQSIDTTCLPSDKALNGTIKKQNSSTANTTISRLNPNVMEFIPKVSSGSSHRYDDPISVKHRDGLVVGPGGDDTARERRELLGLLRPLAGVARDDDEDTFRRNKYAAIANLLKAASNPPPPGPPPPPSALRTPDYFQRSVPMEQAAGEASEADVRLSIEKVTDWFDNKPRGLVPPPAVPPAPHLGPVAYKRKERAAPSPSGQLERKVQRAAAAAYVPTPYAAELSAEWGARGAGEPEPALGMWERLQRDLSRRDEEVRRGGGDGGEDSAP